MVRRAKSFSDALPRLNSGRAHLKGKGWGIGLFPILPKSHSIAPRRVVELIVPYFTPECGIVMIETATVRLIRLRKAIRNNRVSFPSQIPVFVRTAPITLQRYVVQLYFLQGWSCGRIARRYGYSPFYIWQILNEWKRHAVALGYLQAIPSPEVLVDLKNALDRTMERMGRLEVKFKPCVNVSPRPSLPSRPKYESHSRSQ